MSLPGPKVPDRRKPYCRMKRGAFNPAMGDKGCRWWRDCSRRICAFVGAENCPYSFVNDVYNMAGRGSRILRVAANTAKLVQRRDAEGRVVLLIESMDEGSWPT